MAYCHYCGAQTQPWDKFCPSFSINLQAGQETQNISQPQMNTQFNPSDANIESHLAKAIFSTVCCCVPFGIAAIVFAAQVKGKIELCDYQGAKESADKADLWSNLSIGIGFVLIIIQTVITLMTYRF